MVATLVRQTSFPKGPGFECLLICIKEKNIEPSSSLTVHALARKFASGSTTYGDDIRAKKAQNTE